MRVYQHIISDLPYGPGCREPSPLAVSAIRLPCLARPRHPNVSPPSKGWRPSFGASLSLLPRSRRRPRVVAAPPLFVARAGLQNLAPEWTPACAGVTGGCGASGDAWRKRDRPGGAMSNQAAVSHFHARIGPSRDGNGRTRDRRSGENTRMVRRPAERRER